MSGTHLGTYQGIAATGRHFTVETIDFLQIREGKIVHNDVVLDGLEVLRQLGALPPAGSRRERRHAERLQHRDRRDHEEDD